MKDAFDSTRKLAVITGASTGIGYHLAREFAVNGYDLIIVANEDMIEKSAETLRHLGARVQAHNIDLSERRGVENFFAAVRSAGVEVDALVLNAAVTVYGDFVRENPLEAELKLIGLNVSSVVHLAKLLMPAMVARGRGRVLITSSIAAMMPGPLYATYAASKAFLLSFSEALYEELKDTGVSVTALLPGATDTPIFARAGMEHSVVGEKQKDDPAAVAHQAFKAMMRGDDRIVASSWKTKIQAFGASFLSLKMLARLHYQQTKPARH